MTGFSLQPLRTLLTTPISDYILSLKKFIFPLPMETVCKIHHHVLPETPPLASPCCRQCRKDAREKSHRALLACRHAHGRDNKDRDLEGVSSERLATRKIFQFKGGSNPQAKATPMCLY